jgi:hypothetical protein
MRRGTTILLLLAAAAAACGRGAGDARTQHPASGGGGATVAKDDSFDVDEEGAEDKHHRWQLKTHLPAGADLAHPTFVPVERLQSLAEVPGVAKSDKRYKEARIPTFPNPLGLREGQVVTTRGWLHIAAHPSDDDYHLQLTASRADPQHALIVEIPAPELTTDPALRPLFDRARAFVRDSVLEGTKLRKHGVVLDDPPYVAVTGILFYDDAFVGQPPRGKRGQLAGTLWELHPVVSISFLPAPK